MEGQERERESERDLVPHNTVILGLSLSSSLRTASFSMMSGGSSSGPCAGLSFSQTGVGLGRAPESINTWRGSPEVSVFSAFSSVEERVRWRVLGQAAAEHQDPSSLKSGLGQ